VRYLVDTSALVRIRRKQVDPGWREVADLVIAATAIRLKTVGRFVPELRVRRISAGPAAD
jgi:predicted nucleic acid-binding protein